MFRLDSTREQLSSAILAMDDEDFARFLCCQQMAATYIAVAQFEDLLIAAMLTCDRVKVGITFGPDTKVWNALIERQHTLRSSTLGSLIKILERHPIAHEDISYLRWLKDKRDFFIHRLFHRGWPGDMDAQACTAMSRQMIAIQHWLGRGQRRIWFIFQRAGLFLIKDLGDSGLLAMNPYLFKDDHGSS